MAEKDICAFRGYVDTALQDVINNSTDENWISNLSKVRYDIFSKMSEAVRNNKEETLKEELIVLSDIKDIVEKRINQLLQCTLK